MSAFCPQLFPGLSPFCLQLSVRILTTCANVLLSSLVPVQRSSRFTITLQVFPKWKYLHKGGGVSSPPWVPFRYFSVRRFCRRSDFACVHSAAVLGIISRFRCSGPFSGRFWALGSVDHVGMMLSCSCMPSNFACNRFQGF